MAASYDGRLQKLKTRRQGAPAHVALDSLVKSGSIYGSIKEERYEKRSANKATKYALGAMQEVDPEYTATSIEQGNRVKKQLAAGLSPSIPTTFELQGSVPLNIHIKGVSDVDLLVLRGDFITVDVNGVKNKSGQYSDWNGEPAPKLLANLRQKSITVLRNAFPEVDIDVDGAKSIALSGGSLRRKVDVVPSHWHDTIYYQLTQEKKDRGVSILDAPKGKTLKNFPFLHIHHINLKDANANGGAKKTIRLLKTLKADSDYSDKITLSSYDIASLVWQFNSSGLMVQPWSELSLLANAEAQLAYMGLNRAQTLALRTPDNTRCIIDGDEKFGALMLLLAEVHELASAVANEISGNALSPARDSMSVLREAYIPVV